MMHQEKIKPKTWRPTLNEPKQEAKETVFETPFYSLIRVQGEQPEFINFCFKAGDEMALPSSSISKLRFDAATQMIEIEFRFVVIQLKGRHLHPLYRQLLRSKVAEIRAFPKDANKVFDETELYITEMVCDEES